MAKKLTADFWKEKCDIIENMYRKEIDKLYEEKFDLQELRKIRGVIKSYRRQSEDLKEEYNLILDKIDLNIQRILN